jgi:hypothetical protein
LESWCWARTRWRPGYTAPVPQYLDWSHNQRRSWIDRHIGQALSYETWEPCHDQENLALSSSAQSSRIRRNPSRSTCQSTTQYPGSGRDVNSSISNPCGVGSEMHILTSPRVAIPSQLQTEFDFRLYQQVEQHITSFRKQIAYGCGQAFRSQRVTMFQSIPKDTVSRRAPPPTIQPRLAPGPLLPPNQVLLIPESQITSRLPQPTFQVHHMTCTNQQRLRRTENRHRSSRKRGRPAKYTSREEKAAVDAARRRARRRAQRAMSSDRPTEGIPQFSQVTWIEYNITHGNSGSGNQPICEIN